MSPFSYKFVEVDFPILQIVMSNPNCGLQLLVIKARRIKQFLDGVAHLPPR